MRARTLPKRTRKILKYCEKKILFATASPRRRALAHKIKFVEPDAATERALNARGYSRVVPVFEAQDVDEVALVGATETAKANARLKGERASENTDLPIFAFDTVVGLDGKVYGKPKDENEAVEMLRSLCGRTHEVVTAVYFAADGKIIEKNQKTFVTFGTFDKDLVYNYVRSGAPFDKAGGYNIDDAALRPLIKGFDGDYDNVVGLPVALTEKLIEEYLIYGENGHSR